MYAQQRERPDSVTDPDCILSSLYPRSLNISNPTPSAVKNGRYTQTPADNEADALFASKGNKWPTDADKDRAKL